MMNRSSAKRILDIGVSGSGLVMLLFLFSVVLLFWELWNVLYAFLHNDHLHFYSLARILYLSHVFLWTKSLESSY